MCTYQKYSYNWSYSLFSCLPITIQCHICIVKDVIEGIQCLLPTAQYVMENWLKTSISNNNWKAHWISHLAVTKFSLQVVKQFDVSLSPLFSPTLEAGSTSLSFWSVEYRRVQTHTSMSFAARRAVKWYLTAKKGFFASPLEGNIS